MTKTAITDKGVQLLACPGCGHIVRSHAELEDLDTDLNWTHTCPRCERKLCVVCFPQKQKQCALLDCATVHAANATRVRDLVDAPLFGGALRGDEPLPTAPEAFQLIEDEE